MKTRFSFVPYAKWLLLTVLLISDALSAYALFPDSVNGIDPSRVGVLITDLKADTVVMDHNGSKWLVPASVMKSVTSAAVLMTTPPDERLSTEVYRGGDIDRNGVMAGNLIIKCVGDPTVESCHFPDNAGFTDSIAGACRRAGIKKIKGAVVVENTFKDEGIPAGWLEEDVIWPYGTGLYGANFRDNLINLSLPSGKTRPHVPTVEVDYTASKGALSVKRSRGSKRFVVSGKIPSGGYSKVYANPDPTAAMTNEVADALAKAGIEVEGQAIDGGDTWCIYRHTSPTVKQILRSLMVRSDNMMAEGMLRTLAPGESRADAVDIERNLWQEIGLPVEGLVIEDGSGLSRNDRLSPLFLTELYKHMLTTSVAADYVSLFPRAGHDGTMRNFLKGTALDGRVAMKTGSMRGVQCFGGYMLDDHGVPAYSIVVLVNGFTCDRARVKSEISSMLLELLADK